MSRVFFIRMLATHSVVWARVWGVLCNFLRVKIMDLIAALNWRYAVRKFSDEIIDEDTLHTLLAATCQSASSYGLQPYRLLVVKSAETRQQLLVHSLGQDKVAYSIVDPEIQTPI
jgi:hypothetical protein